ncbi:SAF domain-containing protein [Bifidobacterium aquikefiricola]|uniref:SAF domain-containing protein n=1 Tax=Bifidobacterium aquikefiricola TaxID=3059038 RepID=A0AB39U5Q7_9BIFI
MLDFLSSRSCAKDSLQRRRFNAHVRQILCALCAGLILFAVCQSIAEGSRNHIQIVVASHDIARGQKLSSKDLSLVSIPKSSISRHFVHSIEAADGKQSQTILSAGQPLTSNAISEGLSIAAGRTSIQIQLASVPAQLSVGDTVRLVSSGSCSTSESGSASGGEPGSEPGAQAGSDPAQGISEDPDSHSANTESNSALNSVCTLAQQAQVLSITEPSDDSLLNSITANTEDKSLITFCVSPEEAVAVLSQQEQAPILAVSD